MPAPVSAVQLTKLQVTMVIVLSLQKIAPPSAVAVLPANAQPIKTGLALVSLWIAPPFAAAELPMKVQSVKVGVLLRSLAIAPPPSEDASARLPVKRQRENSGWLPA